MTQAYYWRRSPLDGQRHAIPTERGDDVAPKAECGYTLLAEQWEPGVLGDTTARCLTCVAITGWRSS
jgi:hypothetical protein